jgi:hypothetical protein
MHFPPAQNIQVLLVDVDWQSSHLSTSAHRYRQWRPIFDQRGPRPRYRHCANVASGMPR